MTRQLQIQLAAMTLEEFRVWYATGCNADNLPAFHNSRWLADQPDPALEVYQSLLIWEKKRPWID